MPNNQIILMDITTWPDPILWGLMILCFSDILIIGFSKLVHFLNNRTWPEYKRKADFHGHRDHIILEHEGREYCVLSGRDALIRFPCVRNNEKRGGGWQIQIQRQDLTIVII